MNLDVEYLFHFFGVNMIRKEFVPLELIIGLNALIEGNKKIEDVLMG